VSSESPESNASPYDAPAASLEPTDDTKVVSAKAMHYLLSSKWWMIMASVALMVVGALMLIGVFYTLIKTKSTPALFKLALALVVIAANLIFLPGLRLMQCALALSRVRRSKEERDMMHALHRHEEFWRYLGVAFLYVGGLLFYVNVFISR
jgi:hypothetical protein